MAAERSERDGCHDPLEVGNAREAPAATVQAQLDVGDRPDGEEEADDHRERRDEDRTADAVEAERERDVRGDDDPDEVDREEIPPSEPGREPDDWRVGGRDRRAVCRLPERRRGRRAAREERRPDRAADGQCDPQGRSCPSRCGDAPAMETVRVRWPADIARASRPARILNTRTIGASLPSTNLPHRAGESCQPGARTAPDVGRARPTPRAIIARHGQRRASTDADAPACPHLGLVTDRRSHFTLSAPGSPLLRRGSIRRPPTAHRPVDATA